MKVLRRFICPAPGDHETLIETVDGALSLGMELVGLAYDWRERADQIDDQLNPDYDDTIRAQLYRHVADELLLAMQPTVDEPDAAVTR